MKFGLTLRLTLVFTALAAAQPITDCFKVYSLIKMDEDHYWANWANACPYTIDSVYVMMGFSSHSGQPGNGVMALHFITPGTHQVTRLTAPRSVADFDSIHVRKITTNASEALVSDRNALAAQFAYQPGHVGDPGAAAPITDAPVPEPQVQRVATYIPGDGRVVGDEGPAVWESRAIARVSAPLAIATASAEDHHRLGRQLLEKGDYAGAIAELSEAIRQQPDHALALNARGFAYYMAHDYAHANADLDEAIRLNPRYLNAYQNRSRSRKASGDRPGSDADRKKARTLLNLR